MSWWDSTAQDGNWGSLFTLGDSTPNLYGVESVPASAPADSSGWGWSDAGKLAATTLSDMARSWAGYEFNATPDVIRAKELGASLNSGYGYYRPGQTAAAAGGGISLSSDVLILGAVAVVALLALR